MEAPRGVGDARDVERPEGPAATLRFVVLSEGRLIGAFESFEGASEALRLAREAATLSATSAHG